MPVTTSPALPAGRLSGTAQPAFGSADGALWLRPWDVRDAAALYAAFRDPEIRHWHARRTDSPGEAREWIEAAQRDWERERAAQWTVCRAGGGEPLGRVGLGGWNLHEGLAHCAYWVVPEARGAGVAPTPSRRSLDRDRLVCQR